MTADNWRRLDAILDELLDLAPQARAGRLAELAGDDRALREEVEGLRRTPIIALTANAMAHHAAEYASAGMDVLVPKPLELERLIGAIQSVMEEAA